MSREMVAQWEFNEGHGKFIKESVRNLQDHIRYVFNDNVNTPYSEPQWRSGIRGSSLLFDGYSTWIEGERGIDLALGKELTIEAWIAPRSFGGNEDERLTPIVNQHNREMKLGFILGVHKHGKWSFQVGANQRWIELWSNEYSLPKYKWSHVTATFDGEKGYMKLYLNGQKVAETQIDKGLYISECKEDLLIGKSNYPIMIEDVFSLNMYSGLIDKVAIYKEALSPTEVQERFSSYLKPFDGEIPSIPYDQICIDRHVYDYDRHKPKYHITAPGLWMNEPHAPFYFEGKYHLFYQHNPQGPYWGNIQWGHWVSEDLVHWSDLPIALETSDDDLAPDGIWSGNAAYDEDGFPVLFFTAGNMKKTPNQTVAIARSTYKEAGDKNLINWEKHHTPVAVQPENLGLHHDGFRDPFVWKEEDTWYLIVGSGIEGKCGTVVVFSSINLIDWEYCGLLYDDLNQKYPYLGEVWELPILLPISEGKHIFIISPVGSGANVEVFYWIGVWDKVNFRFIPDQDEPQLIDLGNFNFTGPSAMIDPKTGRIILFTIAQGQRTLLDEYQAGWAHNGGLPVELWLRNDGRLGVKPIKELEALRGKRLVSIQNQSMNQVNEMLENVKGNMLEIRLELQEVSAEKFGIKVLKSESTAEEVLFFYDNKDKELKVYKPSLNECQGGKIVLNKENLKLHIYIDCSMVECYANELKSLTTRFYPTSEDALGIQVWGDGDLKVISMEIWDLESIHKEK